MPYIIHLLLIYFALISCLVSKLYKFALVTQVSQNFLRTGEIGYVTDIDNILFQVF